MCCSFPDGNRVPLRVRSMVGLIPLFAVEVLDDCVFRHMPEFTRRLRWFLDYRPDLATLVSRWNDPNSEERHLLSLLRGHRVKRLLARMLDESEFLSEYGIRAVSKRHEHEPFVFEHPDRRSARSPTSSRSSRQPTRCSTICCTRRVNCSLARVSSHTAVVVGPHSHPEVAKVRSVQLVRLQPSLVLALAILSNGNVEKCVLHLADEVDDATVAAAGLALDAQLTDARWSNLPGFRSRTAPLSGPTRRSCRSRARR